MPIKTESVDLSKYNGPALSLEILIIETIWIIKILNENLKDDKKCFSDIFYMDIKPDRLFHIYISENEKEYYTNEIKERLKKVNKKFKKINLTNYNGDMLSLELFRKKNIVYGKVLHQEKAITRIASIDPFITLYISKNIEILSASMPVLQENALCIRGSDIKYDNRFFQYTYKTKKEAKKMVKEIKLGLLNINYSI